MAIACAASRYDPRPNGARLDSVKEHNGGDGLTHLLLFANPAASIR
jgi:hypothetical protein